MTISLDDLEFLASDKGTGVLERLAREDLSEVNTLKLLTSLRKEISPSHAGASLETARLRIKARAKFGDDATKMFFTREALEQASDPLIRCYRADILAPSAEITDVCCGIGADSLSFGLAAMSVLGIDIDPVRVGIAKANAAALNLTSVNFEVHDAHEFRPSTKVVFYDPARRDEAGNRIKDVKNYKPPLSLAFQWSLGMHPARVVAKLSPGVDLSQIYKGGVEFISVNGELKEALLWMDNWGGRKATLLTDQGVFHWQPIEIETTLATSLPLGWLCEPDPSILRAGLVRDVAATCGGFLFDKTIAYFTSDEKPESVWIRAWKILDWMPFNLKKLRAYLREHNVGTVTVKKRGVPITPDALIPQLKLKGSESRTLVLTRHAGQMIVLICEDYGMPLPSTTDEFD